MNTDIDIMNREDYITKYWDRAKIHRKSPDFIKDQLKKEISLIWDKFNNK